MAHYNIGKNNPMYGKKRLDLSERNKEKRKYPINHCLDCGKIILPYYKRCFECSLEYRNGENNPNWKNGKSSNNRCKCGKSITYGRKRCWDCWKKELSELYTGKNNPVYIHGKSHEPYSEKWSENLKKLIRERDNYKCVVCHKKGNAVHHIDYDKQNCNEDNLITLCKKHHAITNFNRDYWYAYFTYIMENIYGNL